VESILRTKYTQEQRLKSFWDRVLFTTDCLEWIGAKNPRGYGLFWDGVHFVPAHRYILDLIKRKFDKALSIDHLCKNTSCVNPKHLDPCTIGDNVRRGERANRTHCARGNHPLSGVNLYIHNGQRKCKECRREAWRRWKSK